MLGVAMKDDFWVDSHFAQLSNHDLMFVVLDASRFSGRISWLRAYSFFANLDASYGI
jgi:hypothetical protein